MLSRTKIPSVIGAIQHSLAWPLSELHDIRYKNPKYSSNENIAIYCIHGTADRSSAFSFIANNIINRLPDCVSSIELVSFEKRFQGLGIEQFAYQLRNKIIKNNHNKVILIGHSRGGLVATHYFTHLNDGIEKTQILAIFTIGTPFMGSDLAIAPLTLFSASVDQMKKGSSYLTCLIKKMNKNPIPFFHFAGRKDDIVSVDSACPQLKEHTNIILDNEGHLSMMCSYELVENLLQCLYKTCPIVDTDKEEKEDFVYAENTIIHDLLAEIDQQIDSLSIENNGEKTIIKYKQISILKNSLISHLEKIKDPSLNQIKDFLSSFIKDNVKKNVFNKFIDQKSEIELFIEKLIKKYVDFSYQMARNLPNDDIILTKNTP